MMVFRLVYLGLIGLLLSIGMNAQTVENPERKKVGLVLSGGGAKGIAHIGVLKEMENAGIRPDYIVGTSMGSIIGALYAIGYSAHQLDSITRSIDWDLVLTNNIPLTYISYEEKEYYNRFLVELPFVNKKPTLPTGLIEGQMLTDLLSHLTYPSVRYDSFDDFPIPFRCVATDVSTGKPIIFERGSLAEAIRASMAIPTVFTSADLDTTLAVDGGIVNNFPVELLEDLGADVIIGVDVGDGFVEAKELGSMAGILMQVSMIPSLKRLEEQREKCDIYIKPELMEFTAGSFSSTQTILARGYEAGERFKDQFDSLATALNLNDSLSSGIDNRDGWITIQGIEVKGNRLETEALIKSKLAIEKGDVVNEKMISEGIRRIFGLTSFKKVNYTLEAIEDHPNQMILVIKVMENPPGALKASVHYDNTFSAGVLLNLTLRNIVLKESRFLVQGDISENPKFRLDYLKYFGGNQKFALQFRYNLLRSALPAYEEGKKIDEEISTTQDFVVNAITTNSLKRSFFAGVNFSFNRAKSSFSALLPSEFDYFDLNNTSIISGFISNTFNHRNFPTRGSESQLHLQFVPTSSYSMKLIDGVDTVFIGNLPITQKILNELVEGEFEPDLYGRVFFRHSSFIPLGKNFQLNPRVAIGTVISTAGENSIFDDFNVGGNQMVTIMDTRMYGLNYAEIVAPHFFRGGLGFQNVFFRNVFLLYGVDLLGYHPYIPINQLSIFNMETFLDNYLLFGYGMQVRYKSPLGPISLGFSGNSEDPNLRVYFQIGFSFNYLD
jgi:NTE family protein